MAQESVLPDISIMLCMHAILRRIRVYVCKLSRGFSNPMKDDSDDEEEVIFVVCHPRAHVVEATGA